MQAWPRPNPIPSHPITVLTTGRVASIQLTPTEYDLWISEDRFYKSAHRQTLVKEIYGRIPNFRPHWGLTGGSTPGQLGGFRQDSLKSNVDGKPTRYSAPAFGMNANYGNTVPYNQMELYLMGLIPATEVMPFDVFRDVDTIDVTDRKTTVFEARTKVRYDAARIASELGARSPSHLASQKDFRLLIVVLTKAPLTAPEWTAMDKQSQDMGLAASKGTYLHNFWEATGGRATLQTGNLNSAIKSVFILTRTPARAPLRNRPGMALLPVGHEVYDLSGRRIPTPPLLPAR